MDINYKESSNIVAIATAAGHAGIGIVRVSGTNLSNLIKGLTKKSSLTPRLATYSDFFDAKGEVIDSGIILYFKAPYSFTGEDVIELQGHGSPVVLKMLLERCLELGCVMAKPGEFSRRAYLNGKIDLVQAESIIDLIHAENEASAKGAIKSLQGVFSNYINQVNQSLINIRMFIESSIDFPDEDIEFIDKEKIHSKLNKIKEDLMQLVASTRKGVLLNSGANVVIMGKPNVGKSSILNALAESEVAIVTNVAGTTRDVIREKIQVEGIVLNIFDTAGIRATDDLVEQIGIKRAESTIKNADLCLVIYDLTQNNDYDELINLIPPDVPKIYVYNKVDLLNKASSTERFDASNIKVYLSAKTGDGLPLLKEAILKLLGLQNSFSLPDIYVARTRHLEAIKMALWHIEQAFLNWKHLELLAQDVREAHLCLGSIVGEFSSDDLLGEIFKNFCIGK